MTTTEAAEFYDRMAAEEEERATFAAGVGLPHDRIARSAECNRLAAKALRAHGGLVKALEELADLMEAVRTGEYAPDSFTCQPARAALSEARKP